MKYSWWSFRTQKKSQFEWSKFKNGPEIIHNKCSKNTYPMCSHGSRTSERGVPSRNNCVRSAWKIQTTPTFTRDPPTFVQRKLVNSSCNTHRWDLSVLCTVKDAQLDYSNSNEFQASGGSSGKLVYVLALHANPCQKKGSFAPLDPPLDPPLVCMHRSMYCKSIEVHILV